MSDPDTVAFLATVPLFEEMRRSDLVELARVMRRRTISEGEILWREGAEAGGLALIVDGRVSLTLRLPGERTLELSDVGPGETLGEIALIDGRTHSATARVTDAGSVLFLGRADFAALVARRGASTFALKRRFATVATSRLRRQLTLLGDSLGPLAPAGGDADGARTFAELEYCGPPQSAYVRRMATFRAFDALALWGFLTAGRYARCPRGRTLDEEGTPQSACYLVINGAVEKVLIRGDRRIRVGLAGPGQAFGYEGLIDGEPSPVTAVARERTPSRACSVATAMNRLCSSTSSTAISRSGCARPFARRQGARDRALAVGVEPRRARPGRAAQGSVRAGDQRRPRAADVRRTVSDHLVAGRPLPRP